MSFIQQKIISLVNKNIFWISDFLKKKQNFLIKLIQDIRKYLRNNGISLNFELKGWFEYIQFQGGNEKDVQIILDQGKTFDISFRRIIYLFLGLILKLFEVG
ncbi:unnamed protein product [Paramecium sonneborni]|uniref:Uncharacterized protein n=1 Tax=Paramecium sonneborni TaxID=65129 RepID=A0A8S1NR02_9CILI|nr:unnamed protein product [Paramecium sonneborni]